MATGPNGFVAQLVAAVNAHDLDAVVGLFTADYQNQTPVHPARSFTGQVSSASQLGNHLRRRP